MAFVATVTFRVTGRRPWRRESQKTCLGTWDHNFADCVVAMDICG